MSSCHSKLKVNIILKWKWKCHEMFICFQNRRQMVINVRSGHVTLIHWNTMSQRRFIMMDDSLSGTNSTSSLNVTDHKLSPCKSFISLVWKICANVKMNITKGEYFNSKNYNNVKSYSNYIGEGREVCFHLWKFCT